MLILTTAINFRHHQVSQEILESKAHGGSPGPDTLRAAGRAAPRLRHLPAVQEGARHCGEPLCPLHCRRPDFSPASPTLGESRGEISLRGVTTFAPQNDPFHARTAFAPASVTAFRGGLLSASRFVGEIFSPLLNVATSVSSCAGCKSGACSAVTGCAPRLRAGNQARNRHRDAPASHFLSTHGNKQHCYSVRFVYILGLMCTEPNTVQFCHLCAQQRKGGAGAACTLPAAPCTSPGFELQTLTESQHLRASSVPASAAVLTDRRGSCNSLCVLLKIHYVV